MKTTRQGVRDLNGSGHNGRPRNQRDTFWNRPKHAPEHVFDAFGRLLGVRCGRCRRLLDDLRGEFCTP